jgi:hypothetical protein
MNRGGIVGLPEVAATWRRMGPLIVRTTAVGGPGAVLRAGGGPYLEGTAGDRRVLTLRPGMEYRIRRLGVPGQWMVWVRPRGAECAWGLLGALIGRHSQDGSYVLNTGRGGGPWLELSPDNQVLWTLRPQRDYRIREESGSRAWTLYAQGIGCGLPAA